MPLLAALTCLLLQTPPAGTPAPAPAATPAAAPANAPDAAPDGGDRPAQPPARPAAAQPAPAPAPTAAGTPPRQVWIFVDRWKEFGGTVVGETELDISVSDEKETRSFRKSKVLDIIELVHPKPGQRGLVQLRDGTVVRGEILRDSLEEVEFRVDTVTGRLPREQVYRVVLEADFDERYARLKATIAPEEHGRRLGLARWLADQGRMELAIEELRALIKDADVEEAHDLLRDVNARIKLAKAVEESRRTAKGPRPEPPDGGSAAPPPGREAAGGSAAEAPAAPAPKGPPTTRDMLPSDLLSNEDVNLVRVYEIDFKDPPRLNVPPEGIRQLILRYGSSALVPATTQERNALYSRSPVEVARLLFDLRARDLYSYIEVEEDPASLAKFRTRVHNSWLIGNCATSRCHGGVDAGRFFLYTGNAKDQRIRYTNLLTLLSFKVDGRPMVDFEDPQSSLLIQYALPRNAARFPHPDVKGWKPVLGNSTPQLMQDTVDWIRSMYQPRPEYPVKYVPPRLSAPDRPVREADGPDR